MTRKYHRYHNNCTQLHCHGYNMCMTFTISKHKFVLSLQRLRLRLSSCCIYTCTVWMYTYTLWNYTNYCAFIHPPQTYCGLWNQVLHLTLYILIVIVEYFVIYVWMHSTGNRVLLFSVRSAWLMMLTQPHSPGIQFDDIMWATVYCWISSLSVHSCLIKHTHPFSWFVWLMYFHNG